ncbi:MAG: hypothetical protein R2742_09565 [Micropruina glycogenica]
MQQPSDDRPAGGAAGRDRVRRVRHDDRAVQPAAGAGVLDVAAAQVAVCLITWAGVRLDRPDSRAPLGPLAWAATVTVIAVHLVGIVVAGPGSLVRCLGSLVRCLGWPVWRMVGSDGAPALQWVRIGLGLAAAGLLMALVLRAWRIPSLRPLGVAVATAWVAELLLGQLIAGQFTGDQARHFGLAALYSMLAGLIVWLLALLASAGSPTWSGGPPAETPHAAGDAGVPVPSRSGTRPGSSSP